MKLIDYIVNVFVMVDDFYEIYYPARKPRQRGPHSSHLVIQGFYMGHFEICHHSSIPCNRNDLC